MSKTSAVDTKIHAVSPVSNFTSSTGAAIASAGAAGATANSECVNDVSVVATTTTFSEGVGAVTASSAHATEPPKSAPDKLSANSIFFIRIPQPSFFELLGTQQTSCQIKQRLHLFHRYEYG